MERTLVILKPDALQRNLVGEILARFERKGLKIIGCKMMRLDDAILAEHYAHHKDKPFFGQIKEFMKHSPVVVFVLEGAGAVKGVRLISGATVGVDADAGTIRGDLAMSNQNLVHASDSAETAEEEIKRFFALEELFDYKKLDDCMVYEEIPF
ncbi:MAG: Nucleoside diphosphate kinase [Parcubacteria group bacterium GW2011_GWC2_44_17]|uniref:Nucleoside diphosphate kinase n=1 Tax=Candidatus Jacksonbacteria bacterium RIFCSPLOWO2_02_FULL_44_20 TaxID=1798460 RepID=A0A1G2A9A3_9BACT|nr:MAG: Nucleoside diphosphate kinase [Parcubacteria group bacterium GW2011_GWC2_44_17]OGY69565.1 MAG: nucleoside-diphosphate kinase [Candidatus Jacksonbacteria bacterium RIFCSPHIGHO2_02_FULL_44_25]OGY72630.1 MAG: nucleoside-diphosphate kinase [Candidatus Jacksonbacteria bacterium RIFCSPLOWO2_02_FULL_44_20]OGY74014.1 MAG: nucleoside-diphosphate kinase [Candidatus Jacksonbacteria bacterium RIFCSPLOWO2_12_FULL_44_15b]HCA66867.1 nucleoside-diphosphate kinase [Candidatus Jacksonbacteria bacterium]